MDDFYRVGQTVYYMRTTTSGGITGVYQDKVKEMTVNSNGTYYKFNNYSYYIPSEYVSVDKETLRSKYHSKLTQEVKERLEQFDSL